MLGRELAIFVHSLLAAPYPDTILAFPTSERPVLEHPTLCFEIEVEFTVLMVQSIVFERHKPAARAHHSAGRPWGTHSHEGPLILLQPLLSPALFQPLCHDLAATESIPHNYDATDQ